MCISFHLKKNLNLTSEEVEEGKNERLHRKEKTAFWFKFCDVNQYFGRNPYYLTQYR